MMLHCTGDIKQRQARTSQEVTLKYFVERKSIFFCKSEWILFVFCFCLFCTDDVTTQLYQNALCKSVHLIWFDSFEVGMQLPEWKGGHT